MKFIPYGKQTITNDDIKNVTNTLKSDFLTTGPKIEEFEKEVATYVGAEYCVAVANGTAALHLASLCLLKRGDLVLTTPNSFLATANSILYANAKPIFVDIEVNGNIDLDLCEKELKKNKKIKALYVVHFSGNPINQERLNKLKTKYKIKILEDCAHSIGAIDNGIKAGSCANSDLSILSFHPVKHFTTGEGGAVTTNSKKLYKKLLALRNHGMVKNETMKPWEYKMKTLGFNYRLTDISCALGLSQIKKLDDFIANRKQIAKRYDKAFENTIVKPLYTFDDKSSYHLYVVRVDFKKLQISKEELFVKLKELNIGLQLHYMPINQQPYYKALGYGNESHPKMKKYYKECFSLPIYPLLSENEQNYVIANLFGALK